MERAGVPRLSPRRSSVEAKMQSTSCRVRKSSTVTAWPAVVLLLSWGQRGDRWGNTEHAPTWTPSLCPPAVKAPERLQGWEPEHLGSPAAFAQTTDSFLWSLVQR
uniref:Uncharacterized protein n=1 Tax=Equus asinus TaxID=9793 RepID=A0A9L0IFK4_EQUAS